VQNNKVKAILSASIYIYTYTRYQHMQSSLHFTVAGNLSNEVGCVKAFGQSIPSTLVLDTISMDVPCISNFECV
jgi:hypothetical protein